MNNAMVSLPAVPQFLDCTSSQHILLISSNIELSTLNVNDNESRKNAETFLKECQNSDGYLQSLLVIVKDCPNPSIRLVAVTLIKRLVGGCWKITRGAAIRTLTNEEKSTLKAFLIGNLQSSEKQTNVATQLSVLTSKVARLDWPKDWPELFPALILSIISDATADNGLKRARSLYTLHLVLKEFESKKFNFDKNAFQQTVKECISSLRELFGSMSPIEAQIEVFESRIGPIGMKSVTRLVKVVYRMLLIGISPLTAKEFYLWLSQLMTHMQGLVNMLSNTSLNLELRAYLSKQLKRCAITFVDAVKYHPIFFSDCLNGSLRFFEDYLIRAVNAHGVENAQKILGNFPALCLEFLGAVINSSTYQEFLDSEKHEYGENDMARQELLAFWTSQRIENLYEWILTRLFPLTPLELTIWKDDPENFVLEQDQCTPEGSLRAGAENLYISILESPYYGGFLASTVSKVLRETLPVQIEALGTADLNDNVVYVDAIYLSLGHGIHSLEGHDIDISKFTEEVLGPRIKWMLEGETPQNAVPILLRRGFWVLGRSAGYLSPGTMQNSVFLVAEVLNRRCNVAVQLAALVALQCMMERWDFEGETCLVPVLGELLNGLFLVFQQVQILEHRALTLEILSSVLEKVGKSMLPFANTVISLLPSLWHSSETQPLLRTHCISTVTQVVQGAGSAVGLAQALAPVVIPLVNFATDLFKSDHDLSLTDPGLELWLTYMYCLDAYIPELHGLFNRLPHLLTSDVNHMKTVMLLLEAYIVLGRDVLLFEHGTVLLECLNQTVTQVKASAAQFGTSVMTAMLIANPTQSATLLGPSIVPKLVWSVLTSAKKEPNCEPEYVVVQHITVLTRFIVINPDEFKAILAMQNFSSFEFFVYVIHLNDSGENSLARRKLWAWALLMYLREITIFDQAQKILDDIVNMCVSALTWAESTISDFDSSSFDRDDRALSDSYRNAFAQFLKSDFALSVDLNIIVKASLDTLASNFGEAKFCELLESAEPAVLKHLEGLVRNDTSSI